MPQLRQPGSHIHVLVSPQKTQIYLCLSIKHEKAWWWLILIPDVWNSRDQADERSSWKTSKRWFLKYTSCILWGSRIRIFLQHSEEHRAWTRLQAGYYGVQTSDEGQHSVHLLCVIFSPCRGSSKRLPAKMKDGIRDTIWRQVILTQRCQAWKVTGSGWWESLSRGCCQTWITWPIKKTDVQR